MSLPSSTAATAKPSPRKRKAAAGPATPSRKSTRLSQQVVDFQGLGSSGGDDDDDDDDDDGDDDTPIIRRKKKRVPRAPQPDGSDAIEPRPQRPRANPKVFGPIEGVEVGDWWALRTECGAGGVHTPTVAGIFGGANEGCYSVAVSAGYPEDRDDGDTFTYTGSGGRELKKKNLRTAPQSRDQELTRGNAALDRSAQTGNPIRVIRGYKAPLGPVTGYRYDGLYRVVRSYQAMNSEGKFKVYKFDFERLPGQPPVDYQLKRRHEAEQAARAAAAGTAHSRS